MRGVVINLRQFAAAETAAPRYRYMPSTVIRAHWYSARKQELTILFQTGRAYTYLDVPEEIYAGMQAAASKGEFFNQEIRGRYAFVRNADVPR